MGFKYCKEGHLMDPSWKYCPVCLAPLSGWLVELGSDGRSWKFHTLHEGKSFIGSGAECEVRILGKKLRRQQALLTIKDRLCTISDIGNVGEMLVNNISRTQSTVIDGDIIEFDGSRFLLKLI